MDGYWFDWRASLPDGAWGAHRDGAQWLVDHVPMDRLFAAFEEDDKEIRRRSTGDSTAAKAARIPDLFSLCVRMVIPFAIIDAALQSRLPMLAGNLDAAVTPPHDLLARSLESVPGQGHCNDDHDNDGGGHGCDGPWWVSCCTCATGECNHPADCPRPRLARIDNKAARRILVWHWVDLVEQRIMHAPCEVWTHATGNRYRIGLYQWSWDVVTGRTAHGSCTPDTRLLRILSGPVFWVFWSHKPPDDATSIPDGTTVAHPCGDALRMHYHVDRETYLQEDVAFCAVQDWSAVAWVRGDPDFIVEVFS
ncbi:hypothetical protein pqer_cds_398 [Pandoravirus quercus]|uniref:Uncharacterized protein n=1 Tax=Pandoravirus quercus TaxID=2107709 RepID=A0A2U7U8V4_9VIRU|nr:hypothetical protein pqer_cds_398 [Pandoravirus quercus]AVK74820.1 hypothetical protein pqer_cds_398 [Pandoravirus quercus]